MWRYAEVLPINPDHAVTLQEGGTPLVELPRLAARFGIGRLWLKDEGRNPTASFKDRLASLIVSRAKEVGAPVVTIASSGNAGAALAAYAARAGLDCVIFTMANVPDAMKLQMQVTGAKLVATPLPGDRWTLMQACVERFGWYPASNYSTPPLGSNPFGVEGYKTIAYEIAQDLDWEVPDWVAFPVCYGDGLWGATKGFQEMMDLGLTGRRPRMIAGEIFGSLESALDQALPNAATVPARPSVAVSIATGRSTYQALHALRVSDGIAVSVPEDRVLLELQQLLATTEGLYVEPSSVTSLAAVRQLASAGRLGPTDRIVAITTATGLKDPAATAKVLSPIPTVSPDMDALLAALKSSYGFDPS
ncbi:MAG: pyridoxal-phosphate dependent enzyme [Ardenticatenaceae bacterium]|nr:pyridoxal-phosphate dependent enzyme [Ardenticatenaceae bacterium]HBY92681.1 threonine synthase [Chloroflexota bacterium]